MFEPLPGRIDFPAAEKGVLEFWEKNDVFAETVRRRAGCPRFVFYEGPPTANGMPHPGHCLTRVMKDVFPRYKTMCGFLVERKGGWDTHGLPVEREVCKELGIRTKQEIEAYGVEKFNLKCIQSVFRYTREWEEMTRRLAYWVDLKDAYVTFHQSYVESVWWSLKTLFERGVLYQGHKIVWWWAQGGTALSSGEVGEGYKKVDDPSVFVKFPLVSETKEQGNKETRVDKRVSLLVWTTTPWTLVSNHFAAVHPDLEYSLVHDPVDDEHLYVASALVETIAKKVKRELRVVSTCTGLELVGQRYLPPFRDVYYDCYPMTQDTCQPPRTFGDVTQELIDGGRDYLGWRVLSAPFVTIDSGTGLVHEAPAFGEVDFGVLVEERRRFKFGHVLSKHHAHKPGGIGFIEYLGFVPLLCAVDPDGTFNADAPERYRGRWVKDCDKDIVRELRDERKTPWGTPLLYHQEIYNHDYPFCPQSPDDPLIQYARKSWFVRTSQFKDEFLKNNAAINWLPEHIKEGRFGDFLRNNVDWALSRERYWGTPLPIWQCEKCGKMEAIGSFAELQGKPGATDGGYWETKVAEHKGEEFPAHLRVHKPYIDEWTYECAACAGGRHEGTEARRHEGQETGSRMRRVPEVIDCWWDAGSMPFAQWGFPHVPGSDRILAERFPADFISEAIDQTRGWFYGLLAISTLLFEDSSSYAELANAILGNPDANPDARAKASRFPNGPAYRLPVGADRETFWLRPGPFPFRTCIVLGHIAGEDGNKMSKKLRNYKEPTYIFDTLGADAMRWYFLSAQAPWTSTRFAEAAIRDSQREFLVKLYNVLSFFTIYASIDGFDPSRRDEPGNPMGYRPTEQRGELDRWIVTELHQTVRSVRESMDRFENYPAAQRLNEFVESLSNWYVRRSRDRFWKPVKGTKARRHEGTKEVQASHTADPSVPSCLRASVPASDQDKWDAYHTLYGCLRVFSRLIAPFTPFFAEKMHQYLRLAGDPLSAHLCDYPTPEEIRYCDESLAGTMESVRELVALGRAARTAAKLKVRQPLPLVEIVLSRPEQQEWLREHSGLIAEELNVKGVEFAAEADHYVSYKVVPNFPAIGKKYRALVPGIKAALEALSDPAAARKQLVASGVLALNVGGQSVELTPEEVEIRLDAKPGWAAAQGKSGVVVLSTEISPELREEGVVRELIHFIQAARKERNLAYEARICLHLECEAAFQAIVTRFEETIKSECLVTKLVFAPPPSEQASELDVEGHKVKMAIVEV